MYMYNIALFSGVQKASSNFHFSWSYVTVAIFPFRLARVVSSTRLLPGGVYSEFIVTLFH